METMQSDGSWGDIDYVTVKLGLDGMKHLERLVSMSISYKDPNSAYYKSKELLQKTILGIDFFFKKRPASTNWWYVDIGIPQKYMIVLLLLKDEIGKEKLMHYSSYLKDRTDNPKHRGKNRTWVSSITIHKGCIENDYKLVEKGFQSIASTIKIESVQGIEGIKIDNSIHQHRPQLYSGGYGMGFMTDLIFYIDLARDLSFSGLFTPEKMKIITETMLQGQLLFGYRESYDFGTVGRNISRKDNVSNILPMYLDMIMKNDKDNVPVYQQWKDHLAGGAFPITGNKYFWKSDIMTHHGENYYMSAKVISTRTNGTEMLNGENTKGYNLPLGATNIMVTGNEYKNIFPLWDWSRVPGTTSLLNQSASELRWYFFGSNKFAGGVSDNKNGFIAFDHAYNGIEAKKAYFFMGDAMLCLGNGISACETQRVVTSIDQSYTNGDIYLKIDGQQQLFNSQSITSENVDWVHHNNISYIFPQKGKLTIQNTVQKGSWHSINESGSTEEESAKVFSLWFDHGHEPQNDTYCYVVMPDNQLGTASRNNMEHGFKIIENTGTVQAVENTKQKLYAVVFYEPATVKLSENLTVSSDKRVLLLIDYTSPQTYNVSVSDPVYSQESVNISFSKKLFGDNAAVNKNGTDVRFYFPEGDYQGSTVTKTYQIKN